MEMRAVVSRSADPPCGDPRVSSGDPKAITDSSGVSEGHAEPSLVE